MIVNLVHYYDIIGTLMMQSVGVLSLQLLGIGLAYSFVSAVLLDAFLNLGGLLVNLWTVCAGHVRASSGQHQNYVYRP